MTQPTPIAKLKNVKLRHLIDRFGLQLVRDDSFFPEWQEDLPEVSEFDKLLLARMRQAYFNLVDNVPCLGRPVQTVVISPLLFLANFFTPPFKVREEGVIDIEVEDDGIFFKGQLVIWSLNDRFKLMIIESEKLAFSVNVGLGQMLAFMMSRLGQKKPTYGLIVAASSFVFLKLQQEKVPRYATSEQFSLWHGDDDMYKVFQIIKRLGYKKNLA
jgi:hypothetical protein